jgi:hypothetical protein
VRKHSSGHQSLQKYPVSDHRTVRKQKREKAGKREGKRKEGTRERNRGNKK